jgi:hypothetical protein
MKTFAELARAYPELPSLIAIQAAVIWYFICAKI